MISLESSTSTAPALHLRTYDQDVELSRPAPSAQLPDVEMPNPFRERVILNMGSTAVINSNAFVNLTRMHLIECAFNHEVCAQPLPVMPQLLQLEVKALRVTSHRYEDLCSTFISAMTQSPCRSDERYAAEHHVLHCPSLKTLRISARAPTGKDPRPVRLSPDMVVAFVRTYLIYEDQLELLWFNAIEFVVPCPRDFDSMLHLAQETKWDDLAVRWDWNETRVLDWS